MTNIKAIDHIIDVYSKATSKKDFTCCANIFICNFLYNLSDEGKITQEQHIKLIETIRKHKELANTGNDLYFGGFAFWSTNVQTKRKFKELMQLKIDFLNKIKPLV